MNNSIKIRFVLFFTFMFSFHANSSYGMPQYENQESQYENDDESQVEQLNRSLEKAQEIISAMPPQNQAHIKALLGVVQSQVEQNLTQKYEVKLQKNYAENINNSLFKLALKRVEYDAEKCRKQIWRQKKCPDMPGVSLENCKSVIALDDVITDIVALFAPPIVEVAKSIVQDENVKEFIEQQSEKISSMVQDVITTSFDPDLSPEEQEKNNAKQVKMMQKMWSTKKGQ